MAIRISWPRRGCSQSSRRKSACAAATLAPHERGLRTGSERAPPKSSSRARQHANAGRMIARQWCCLPVLRRPREKDDEGEETRASHSFADAAPSASLPPELWDLIADSVPETHMLSFALICRDTWGVVKDRSLRRRKRRGPEEENGAAAEDSRPGRPRPRGEPRLLRTNLAALYDQCERGETTVSESWIAWACRCFLESTRPKAAAEAASFKRQITRVAAHQGHADALEMMRTDRFPMHDRLCDAAAIGGRLEVLQWALGDHKAGASGRGSSGSGRSWMGGLGSASALDREWPSGQSGAPPLLPLTPSLD